MSSYGYYSYYNCHALCPHNAPQYFVAPSYSTTSDDFQNNQASVASGWLNQGLNASNYPYYQQYQSYNNALSQYAQQPEQKTFTQLSSKSQKTLEAQSRSSSDSSQIIQENSQNLTDDINQLTPQIEAAYEEATGKRRQPVVKRQVITMPGEAGRVQQIVRRLPTPTPDVIERVFIVKPQRDTINLVIERPATPPVQYKDKTVYGKSRRPIINPKVITVAPRTGYSQIESNYQNYQHQIQEYNQSQQMLDATKGYLISPVKYEEQQLQQAQQQALSAFVRNDVLSGPQQTFSQNFLHYNQPMFEQYQQQNFQYPTNYNSQFF